MTRPPLTSNATIRGTAYLGYTIRGHCAACHHHELLDLEALARRLGPEHGALHDDLVPLLKCAKCGSKRIGIRLGGNARTGHPEALEDDWPPAV